MYSQICLYLPSNNPIPLESINETFDKSKTTKSTKTTKTTKTVKEPKEEVKTTEKKEV